MIPPLSPRKPMHARNGLGRAVASCFNPYAATLAVPNGVALNGHIAIAQKDIS